MGNGDGEANEPGDGQEALGAGRSLRDRFRDAEKFCGGQNQGGGGLCESIGFEDEKGVVTKVTSAYREVILDGDIPEVTNKKSDFQVFYASCLWFQELEAVIEADVIDLQAIRKHRNLIIHHPARLLADDAVDVNLEPLQKAHHHPFSFSPVLGPTNHWAWMRQANQLPRPASPLYKLPTRFIFY